MDDIMVLKRTKKIKTKPLVVLIIIVLIGIAAYFMVKPPEAKNYYEFAKCLVEKKATEYGTERCLFCQKQKRVLGLDAFNKYFRDTGFYVQCDINKPIGNLVDEISTDREIDINESTSLIDLCIKMEIKKTPTWIINGNRYIGVINIPKFSELTGCPIPADYEGPLEAEIGGYTG